MEFSIKMNLDNDQFKIGLEFEIARILENIAVDIVDSFLDGVRGRSIMDINGNKIGNWEFTD